MVGYELEGCSIQSAGGMLNACTERMKEENVETTMKRNRSALRSVSLLYFLLGSEQYRLIQRYGSLVIHVY